MKRLLTLLLTIIYIHTASQTLLNKDSLLQLLPKAKEDSAAVLLYINLGQQYDGSEPGTAKMYYSMAGKLSKKINFKLGIIKYITNYTYVLNMEGKFDSGLLLNLQSVALSKEIKDSAYLAKTLINTGTSYRSMAAYDKAVEYYEKGKKIFARFGDKETEALLNDILQVLYSDMHQYEKGAAYGEKAVSELRQFNNPFTLAGALNNLGNNYTSLGKYEKAEALFKELLLMSKSSGDKNMEQNAYLNLGNNLIQQGKYDDIKDYMEKALALAKEMNAMESQVIALKGLSFYYTYKKNYVLAKQYAVEALPITFANDFKVQRGKVYTQLSNLAYAAQQMQEGERYAALSNAIGDSILNETLQKNAQELETKYATATKEAQIVRLESDKKLQQYAIKQKNNLNYILAASALIMLVVSMLVYRNYQHRQKIQQQRISELEKEKQLTATEAVLKGEEQERTRLAKDLHDGLGGMLSGIKYSFANMKGNLVMTADNVQAFERSMDMLDSSIKEMRRVAHNLMPEALVKFGLEVALKDFCTDINQSGAIKVNYQSIGLEGADIPQTTAIAIYRIVQELLNNSIKHAAATNAIVQLTKSGNNISLTVEDDGKGFDTSILDALKLQPGERTERGIGWDNILHRINFLKGKLDVNSQPGKGTSVLVELTA
ncbi:MAG TPA: sensor histidine kinase [Ferruginibacter sp.]|nr:sensor histidine kinase [Ferruginibacter sp.]